MNLPEKSPHSTPLDVLSSNEVLVTDGLRVIVSSQVPEMYHEKLWNVITNGFVELNQKSYEKQDMTKEEFQTDLNSSSVLKYLALDHNEEPIGYMTVHEGLDGINWADTSSLQNIQKETDPEGTPFYIGTVVVPASLRGTQVAASLFRGSYIHLHKLNEATGHQSLVFFDCADANYPGLPEYLKRVSEPSQSFEGVPIEIKLVKTMAWIRNKSTLDEIEEMDVSDVQGDRHEVLDKKHYFVLQETPLPS